MTSYNLRMPGGIPGDITRAHQATTEPQIQSGSNAPTLYGLPVAMNNDGGVRIINLTSDSKDSVYGILVRPFPVTDNSGTSPSYGAGTPPTTGLVDILTRGYINVTCNNGSPAKGGIVYVRTQNPSGAKTVGGIEATADVSAAAAAHAGNTGNGAISAVSTQALAQNGVYNAVCKIAGTNAATFDLYDPNGNLIDQQSYSGSGASLSFAGNQIHATITDGATDFIVGDSFQITVTANTIALSSRTYFMGAMDSSNGNVVEIGFNI